MRISLFLSAFAVSLITLTAPVQALQLSAGLKPVVVPQGQLDPIRRAMHETPDWKLIEPHLPDPATAPIDLLEMQGDLLRVRRFPEDALDYYNYALGRGGDQADLYNKIGITQMELGNTSVARAYFQHVIKIKRKDPQGWNNLGAAEFMGHNFSGAIQCYHHAIRINKKYAVSHSNLGLVYIEQKDFSSAKSELTLALKLDPQIFQHNSSAGVSLHTMSAADRANFCFQMAKVYARAGDEAEMLHQLQTASEAGMDIRYEMSNDRDLTRYVNDPRLLELVRIAKSLRDTRGLHSSTVASALPPAASANQEVQR